MKGVQQVATRSTPHDEVEVGAPLKGHFAVGITEGSFDMSGITTPPTEEKPRSGTQDINQVLDFRHPFNFTTRGDPHRPTKPPIVVEERPTHPGTELLIDGIAASGRQPAVDDDDADSIVATRPGCPRDASPPCATARPSHHPPTLSLGPGVPVVTSRHRPRHRRRRRWSSHM